ncbi:MAG TPA: tautomerase family protein [Tahibacter sp.]|jgi:phenylpyruvate tautomerase PptA (4-oxalocrotonate tautomerase family)|nr:tautomerase family protein [Tahibacter sp.]
MPLARIDIPQGKSKTFRDTLGDVVYQAMRTTINVPEGDRFQIINEHRRENLHIDPDYLGIARSADCILIQITLNEGRTLEQKKAFYLAIADGCCERLGMRREDVFVNLVEVKRENWSFGNGIAQYA